MPIFTEHFHAEPMVGNRGVESHGPALKALRLKGTEHKPAIMTEEEGCDVCQSREG